MQNNYTKTLQLLQLTQTQSVNQAQHKLTQLATNDPHLLQYLTTILKDQSIQYTLKLASITYINNLLSDNNINYTKQQIITILINILSDINIDNSYKRSLQRAIVNAIDQLPQPFITQFRELVYKYMKDQKFRDIGYMIIGCFCIPDSIDIQHVIYLTKNFMALTLRYIVLPSTKQMLYVVKQYNQILKTWIVVWDRLVKQYDQYLKQKKKAKKNNKTLNVKQPNQQSIKLLQQITQSQQLCSVIFAIYPWMCQQPLFICTIPQLQQLNILKQQAAQLHHRSLKFCSKRSTQTKIFNLTTQIIPNIINNLVLIANNQNVLDKYICRDFVINLVKVVTQYLLCKPSTFKKDWKQLLSTVIFPLVKPNQQQKQLYQSRPSQFVSIFQDSTQKQTYGILKTQICRLLQKIADRSQSITQQQFIPDFIINFCVDSIKAYFKQPIQNIYGIQWIGLDVAITTICIFSFRLSQHRNKISQLKTFVTKNFAYGLNHYDRTIFYLFLSYNYQEMYQNPDQGGFWIQVALKQNSHQTTKHCANDLLFNIADQYYSDYFIQNLGNKILTNQQSNIWDALQKLIQNHYSKISPTLTIQLINHIYKRLQIQLQHITNDKIKQTITILKLIQILKTIAEKDDYCRQYNNVVKQLWKIMIIFNKAVELSFQDQIFQIVQALVRQQDHISDTSKQVLSLILHQFARNQYYQLYFYKIINHFIIKSTSQIIPPILKSISTGIIFHTLNMGQAIKKSQRRLINGHLLILLQNILAIHGKNITLQQIIQVSAIVIRYLPSNQQQKIDCGVVLARALNVLFLCHMFVKGTNTWELLSMYSKKQIYCNYDIKVLLALIKIEIFRQTDVTIAAQMIIIAADAIRLFRKKQKADQTAKKIKAKYGKDNRLKLLKYKQYQQILKYLQTPFKSQTKLQVQLTNLLQSLKLANKDHYILMISHIDKQKTNQICQMCQFVQGNLLNKRPKFTVLRPKAPQQVEKQENSDQAMKSNSENQEQQEQFKRKRLEKKKKRKQMTSNKNDMS